MDMRPYSSFLLRCWDLDDAGERVEIEHIQTQDSTSLHAIADAVEWIRVVHHRAASDRRHADTAHHAPANRQAGDHHIEGEVT